MHAGRRHTCQTREEEEGVGAMLALCLVHPIWAEKKSHELLETWTWLQVCPFERVACWEEALVVCVPN